MQYLVGQAGRLVTQEQILQAVWPETFVQPDVLRKYILEIRRVLEDPPRNPRYIETVSRRGYRFIAPVREEAPAAPDPEEIPARLVGRAVALSELDDALGGVLQGRSQVVFVSGEAGIGKTTLVDTFQQRWARDGRIQIARGQCVEGFGGKEAYYPVLEALGRFMRAPSGEFLRQTLAAQAPTWLIQFPSLVRPEQRELLRREILGATGERMVREFCEALESVTAEHP
ncbi:MAG TPA: AAA family ATPase, partial [Bryobacteraceae bacterium]|nr:AAA family ATPase [Bryobacteraceae bacterium]